MVIVIPVSNKSFVRARQPQVAVALVLYLQQNAEEYSLRIVVKILQRQTDEPYQFFHFFTLSFHSNDIVALFFSFSCHDRFPHSMTIICTL